LSEEQLASFARDMDELRARTVADLGERDAAYIRKVMRAQRRLEVLGRGLMFLGPFPPTWIAAVVALSLSKILDNMEIGHNVMHGQYDWMNDPTLKGNRFDWDTACPGEQWRHSHNYLHHTFTNIIGRDRDVGYGVLRMSDAQPWNPYYLGNLFYATLLAFLFQYGVAFHDLEVERLLQGKKSFAEFRQLATKVHTKIFRQSLKDYVLFPVLTGPFALSTLAGNATANVTRNLWAFMIIFCGHFPDGTVQFTEAECAGESRGHWYYRQLLAAANLTGGKLFHLLAGNLSYQIEHHLFPDLPAVRYGELSDEVRAICRRYGLPYNSDTLGRQFGSVVRKIARYSLPSRTSRPTTQVV
jgi:fatty acid desaturase